MEHGLLQKCKIKKILKNIFFSETAFYEKKFPNWVLRFGDVLKRDIDFGNFRSGLYFFHVQNGPKLMPIKKR